MTSERDATAEMLGSDPSNSTCAKNAQVRTAPAEMPGVEEIARLIDPEAWDIYLPHMDRAGAQEKACRKARAILALFAPILAEKEQAVKEAMRECAKWATEAGEAKGRLEASELAGVVEGWRDRALAAEAALAAERERCAKIAEETGFRTISADIAAAIRAQANQEPGA